MRSIEWEYQVKAHFSLTKDEIALLMQCCKHHYDGTVQAAGRPGGIVFGWNNCVEMSLPCRAYSRDIDLVLKALEGPFHQQRQEAATLGNFFAELFRTMQEKTRQINA